MSVVAPIEAQWSRRLRAEVGEAFERTGRDTPGWLDPHPRREPLAEEYSRCLDPGKYRILGSRVAAWVEVLQSRSLAVVHEEPSTPWVGVVRPPGDWARVRRLAPTAAGGLALVLAETIVDGAPFGLDVGIGGQQLPTVHIDSIPGCGCDACDSGSEDLLECVDDFLLTVMSGGVVHARSGESSITRTLHGWRGSGLGATQVWLDPGGDAPADLQRWIGSAWLTG